VTTEERIYETDEFQVWSENVEGMIGDESEGDDCDEVICADR